MSAGLPPQVVQALLRRERQALVGRLLRGVVHNVSGALQMMRLPLDLVELQLNQGQQVDLTHKLGALRQGVDRLSEELNLLSSQSLHLQTGEAQEHDLASLVREFLAFWRADMYFKHQVQLRDELGNGVRVKVPVADLGLAFNAVLANALEALRAEDLTTMGLRILKQDEKAGLLIWDEAPPPPADVAQRLGQPFVSGKGGEHDGLGIFLAGESLAPWGGQVSWHPGPPKGCVLWLPSV